MRRFILAAALALSLGGCAVIDWATGSQGSKTVVVQTVIDACDAFQLGLQGATVARKANALSPAVIAKIDALIPPVQAICPPQGHVPSGVVDALVVVVSNTAAIIAATKAGGQ